MAAVPHVWYTTDAAGGDCRHLAMSQNGAEQAHLLHHGLFGCDTIQCVDEGPITEGTDRKSVCLDAHCTMYALMFPD